MVPSGTVWMDSRRQGAQESKALVPEDQNESQGNPSCSSLGGKQKRKNYYKSRHILEMAIVLEGRMPFPS